MSCLYARYRTFTLDTCTNNSSRTIFNLILRLTAYAVDVQITVGGWKHSRHTGHSSCSRRSSETSVIQRDRKSTEICCTCTQRLHPWLILSDRRNICNCHKMLNNWCCQFTSATVFYCILQLATRSEALLENLYCKASIVRTIWDQNISYNQTVGILSSNTVILQLVYEMMYK